MLAQFIIQATNTFCLRRHRAISFMAT